ncbi:hypothetical protein CspHIS471_0307500 [Cutaneotrichosporon sp. HIS471]|nr:hypothetical protein CspHIS471_0307500 [Cutaneotrichosporon sp. HIS471]
MIKTQCWPFNWQIATQIALAHKRCKVIAIVGSQDKVEQLKALGCEIVLNYKQEGFAGRMRAAGSIDVYFDNVGGELLDLVLAQINPYARVVMCGAISQYNTHGQAIRCFIAFDYEKRYPEARAYLADLARKGQLKYSYYVVGGGLDGCAKALQDMFDGKNIGKTVVSFQDEGDRNPKL